MLVNILQNTISSFRSASSAIITSGLKMWLGFKTSSISGANQITPDLSGNSNVGKLFTGKALDFNGSTDSVDIDGFQLAGSDATFAFWINPSLVQNKYILDVTITRFVIGFNNNELSIFSGGSFFNFGAITSSEWSRVAIVLNGTSASCYVNGVQLGTTKTITAISIGSATSASIGSNFAGTATYYDGKLSDFQIYNAVWSADDIAYDYAKPNHLVTDNPSTSLTVTNLKGYWALSEGAGSIAYDSSGEGIDGAISGATYTSQEPKILQLGMVDYSISTPVSNAITLVANPSNPSQDILGTSVRLREHAFNLDGSGYSSADNSSTLQFGTNAFTIQAWIKPFSLASNNRILTKGVTGNGEFMLSVGGDNASLRVYAKDSSGNVLDTSNDFSSLTADSWQMITVIIDTPNDQILFFKDDGSVESKTGASWSGNFNNTEPITIGNTSSVSAGQFFDGLVSDALVYDRLLTSDEVENNYKAGLSTHSAGSSFSDDFSGDYGN